jgi:triphosphoribosyl-dephospho-CoA synthase
MTFPLRAQSISGAFLDACRDELRALKPGNVHIFAAGHGMETKHFADAAEAAAPFVAHENKATGARILEAVEASFAVANCNTNLGILLLCVPLAVAAGDKTSARDLRRRLTTVLRRLDRTDAEHVFRAIVTANPAGLGKVEDGDVATAASMTLLEAMRLAADRDRIARAYVTDFEDVFDFGLPKLEAARRETPSEEAAITALHMEFLSTFTDSHIIRKFGTDTAEYVRSEAKKRAHFTRGNDTSELMSFDRLLKDRGLNPGTTADFVVATLYADKLIALSATESPA